eukprot:gene12728-14034_t
MQCCANEVGGAGCCGGEVDGKEFGFIVVHLGAGFHSKSKLPRYKSLCHEACRLGIELCKAGHIASEISCKVVSMLEDSDLTNAGIGSNLTKERTIQCDASMMDSLTGNFAAVGCIELIKNPIKVAFELLKTQGSYLEGGLVPPMVLVGDGAKKFALERGVESISRSEMITQSSVRSFHKAMKVLESGNVSNIASCENCDVKKRIFKDWSCETFDGGKRSLENKAKRRKFSPTGKECSNELFSNSPGPSPSDGDDNNSFSDDMKLDTVGAICIDKYGNVCSAVSSGGLLLKQPGRIGQAACYGCGSFVIKKSNDSDCVVTASNVSGCGEQLIKTGLAKYCAEWLQDDDGSEGGVSNPSSMLENGFLDSIYLANDVEKMAGCVNVKLTTLNSKRDNVAVNGTGNIDGRPKVAPQSNSPPQSHVRSRHHSLDLIITCTTPSFCVGFMSSCDKKPNSVLLELPDAKRAGQSVVSQGFHYEF